MSPSAQDRHGPAADVTWVDEILDYSEEEHRTRVWRLRQLMALGFDLVRASLIADDCRIDLGQARRLIALGCPLETASRILL
jgi:hypothetical protein